MRTQPRVLRLFTSRAREGRPVASPDIGRELGISEQAAISTLERLWRAQLIIPLGVRPTGFKWRRTPAESVATLRFRLTQRGEARLKWWDKSKDRAANPWSALRRTISE